MLLLLLLLAERTLLGCSLFFKKGTYFSTVVGRYDVRMGPTTKKTLVNDMTLA